MPADSFPSLAGWDTGPREGNETQPWDPEPHVERDTRTIASDGDEAGTPRDLLSPPLCFFFFLLVS